MKSRSGHTPLRKIPALSKMYHLDNLFIKDESKNPFGTYKDRRSEMIIWQAKTEKVDKLAIITSGNAGYSLADFARRTKIKVVAIIDDDELAPSIKEKLDEVCYRVVVVDLNAKIYKPRDIIRLARTNQQEQIWDVTNGYHEAYETIVEEIKKKKPDYIICPVGSGEAFIGIYNSLSKHHLQTKLIGVTSKTIPSFADKLFTPWTPYTDRLKNITKSKKHRLLKLNEKEIHETYKQVKDLLDCEPSSATIFAALSKVRIPKKSLVIAVNSGKGII